MKLSIPEKVRRFAGAGVLAMAGAGLAACGGDGDGHRQTPPPGNGNAPPSTTDSFFSSVKARVNSLLDNDEPVAIEDVTATTPDTTEPEPLS